MTSPPLIPLRQARSVKHPTHCRSPREQVCFWPPSAAIATLSAHVADGNSYDHLQRRSPVGAQPEWFGIARRPRYRFSAPILGRVQACQGGQACNGAPGALAGVGGQTDLTRHPSAFVAALAGVSLLAVTLAAQ